MAEWPRKRIEELALQIGMGPFGSSIKVETFVSEGVPVISGEHLRGTRLEEKSFKFVTAAHAAKLKRSNVYRGDVIFTHAGSIGQCAFIPDDSKYSTYILSQRQFYLRCDLNQLMPQFVTYFFKSHVGQHLLLANASQTGVPSIARPSSYLKTIEVPVPPLPEQRKIANILGALDDKIELNRRMNVALEAMARALFQSWFVDFDPVHAKAEGRQPVGMDAETAALFPDSFEDSTLGPIPKGWRLSQLGIEVKTILGGTPSRAIDEYWQNGTIGWINSGKANEFRIIAASELITPLALESSATKLMPRHTTVVAITGATLGQVSIAEIECCANQSVIGILQNDSVPTAYLYYFMLNSVPALVASQTGGAQQHVNKQNVDQLPIVLPHSQVMKQYLALVGPMLDQIAAGEFQSSKLEEIRATLLPKLLSGELRVGDAAA